MYLRDIWPSREEVRETEEDTIISSIFKDLRERIEVRAPSFFPSCVADVHLLGLVPTTMAVLSVQKGNMFWSNIECPDSVVFPWDHKSTYIRSPSFFSKLVGLLGADLTVCVCVWGGYHTDPNVCVCLRVKRFQPLSR